jgi:hypothetical protein
MRSSCDGLRLTIRRPGRNLGKPLEEVMLAMSQPNAKAMRIATGLAIIDTAIRFGDSMTR